MKQKPLVSVLILSYKNYHYIYEALDSVLCQDYPNIEIIISNDGSDDFNKTAVNEYLQKNKKSNIKNIIINNNSKNIGTVKNINKAIKLSKSEYIVMFAADDAMYDCQVISKLLDAFDTLPKKELVVISQVGMYDTKLKKLIQPFLSKEDIKRINNLSPQKLFAEMSTRCIVPGCGICYKRKIFKKYGYFDEKYVLVEDFSFALKLSRLGVKYNYYDFISVKHRDGGISHGNVNGESQKSRQYELDIINILENEVLPYQKLLTSKQIKTFFNVYNDHKWRYLYKYEYQLGNKMQKREFIRNNFSHISKSVKKEFITDIIDQLKGKKFKIFILGIILLIIYKLDVLHFSDVLSKSIWLFSLLLVIVSIALTLILFIKKYLLRVCRFIKIFL